MERIHEAYEKCQQLIRTVFDIGFVRQPGADQVGRNHAEMGGERRLLMFPLPHRASESMEEQDGRPLSHVEVRHALTLDRDAVDRESPEGVEPLR